MIPKIIHYCWFGNSAMPPLLLKCIESWKTYCPNYEIMRWDESNYDYTKHPYMYEAYKAKKWSFVSDYARLDIICQYGGIYLDTDVELIKNLDSLLDCEGFVGFSVDKKLIATGLGFAAVKGQEMISQMRAVYDNLDFINPDGTHNLQSCPYYNTLTFTKNGLIQDNTFQVIKGICVYPNDYLCPISGTENKLEITDNTYSIHHFTALWYDKKTRLWSILIKNTARFLGASLFSKIRRIKMRFSIKNRLII